MATEAPIDKDFTSPFLSRDIQSLSKDLWDASDDAWLNRTYFAVMDERTARDESLVLCYREEGGGLIR